MILVTGGAGVMGRKLVEGLIKKGLRVRVLALPNDPQAERMQKSGIDVFYGNIADSHSLDSLMTDVDTVYHLAAIILSPLYPHLFWEINYQGTRNLLQLGEKAHVKHFIYVSSASVVYPESNEYARSKAAAEELVRNGIIPHTIVRPTLAYEEGGAAEFMHFVSYLRKYPVVPFIGAGRALKSPVHVDDIIDGLIKIHGNPCSYGKAYNFSGGESLSMRELAYRLLTHMGLKKRILPIPVPFCRLMALFTTAFAHLTHRPPLLTWQTISGIIQDASLDHGSASRDLGYSPRTFREGIGTLVSLKQRGIIKG